MSGSRRLENPPLKSSWGVWASSPTDNFIVSQKIVALRSTAFEDERPPGYHGGHAAKRLLAVVNETECIAIKQPLIAEFDVWDHKQRHKRQRHKRGLKL